jgi:hypothetical protein
MQQRHFKSLPRDLQFLVRLYESAKVNDIVSFRDVARQIGMPDETNEERTDIRDVAKQLVADGYAIEADDDTLSITKAGIDRVKLTVTSVERLEQTAH